VTTTATGADGLGLAPARRDRFWLRYRRNRAAVVGIAVVALLALVAAAAPLLARYPPLVTAVAPPLLPPSAEYPMGTDDLGRDVLGNFVFGARTSLLVGAAAGVTGMLLGLLVGVGAGYWGGRVDNLFVRITEAFQVMPVFFMMLVIVSLVGGSVWLTILVIGGLSWPRTARLVRAEVLALRELEFVVAGRALGATELALAARYVLPNVLPTAITAGSLEIANAILIESGLSFLGLGDPRVASWGIMLNNAREFLADAWWVAVFPGAGIGLAVLGFNLMGEGISDALSPQLVRR
jgi:peptide/nickel transport system permease protein